MDNVEIGPNIESSTITINYPEETQSLVTLGPLTTETITINYQDEIQTIVTVGGQGLPGPTGLAATVEVGSTTTGTAGSNASVVNVGTNEAAILDFTIPQGAKGNSATIAVGTVVAGSNNTDAEVTNVGTVNDAIFDFTLPKGDPGVQGPPGIEGPQGPSIQPFIFRQNVPASVWNINHNLNKYPTCVVLDSANSKVYGDESYPDLNNMTLTFTSTFSGIATLQ